MSVSQEPGSSVVHQCSQKKKTCLVSDDSFVIYTQEVKQESVTGFVTFNKILVKYCMR